MTRMIKTLSMALAAGTMVLAASPATALDLPARAGLQTPGAITLSNGTEAAQHERSRHRGSRDRDRRDRYRDRDNYYGERVSSNTRVWRANDGRYYCRKENGTTGLLIGAAVGGLAGNELAGRRDKTLGTLLGAVGGALLGRAIDLSDARCR